MWAELDIRGKETISPMVSFTVRLQFAPEDRAEIASTLALLATESRREPGCVSYIAHQVQDDPNSFLI